MATCQVHGLDPELYLQEILTVAPSYPLQRILDLSPKRWVAMRQCLIAEGRLKYLDLARITVLECPACKGRMKLVAMVTEPRNIARFLSALGEPTDVPARSPSVDAAAAVLEEHRSAPQGAR
ncbi:hypothetical protein [Sorangium sp. So ce388]|uniref:hypothetical protein n=1 Tax=Sorangium sp. So ce388 TaxID=3133309 RepID=UPI003F5AE6BB